MKLLKRNGPLTLTYQLILILRNEITSGKYPPGSSIPGEKVLMALYGVSSITVRNALDALVQEGFIYRQQGRGTFVSHKKVIRDSAQLKSTTKLFQEQGIQSGAKVVKIEKIPITPYFREGLRMKEGELIYRLKRLRSTNGEPVIIETNYMPEKLFPDLEKKDLSGSLYFLIDSDYHIQLVKSNERYSAITLDKTMAKLFSQDEGTPAIRLWGLVYSNDDIPISYEESIFRGDRFEIVSVADADNPRRTRFIKKM